MLTVLFYYKGVHARKVVLAEKPLRSTLVQRERPSGLAVLYQDRPIVDRDVVTVTFAVWNAGTESVRPENVLLPIELRIEDEADMLDVSIGRVTRPVVSPVVSRDPKNSRAASLSFRILEPGDGFTVQVVYAGSDKTAFSWSGAVEGQGALYAMTREQQEQIPRGVRDWGSQVGGLVFGGFFCWGGIAFIRGAFQAPGPKGQTRRRSVARMRRLIGLVFGTVCATIGLAVAWATIQSSFFTPVPPF